MVLRVCFQVLNIPTKINKGTVEIITPVELIKKGEKVGSSEAALLAKLGIRPFSYGLVIQSVYDDGSVFSPEVLDLTEDDLIEKFATGVSMVTSLALALSYPTLAAAPHMFINAYKNVLAVAVATEYSFPQAEKVKEYLKVCFLKRKATKKAALLPSFQKPLYCMFPFQCRTPASSQSLQLRLRLAPGAQLLLQPPWKRRRKSPPRSPTTTWVSACSIRDLGRPSSLLPCLTLLSSIAGNLFSFSLYPDYRFCNFNSVVDGLLN